ncbi:Prp46p [Saccharomyces cerevisiae x Saccharomyces kudriavzevii VIN7]|uniref:Pre-mRNA-splicing factor PRP46 n=1 Tax=Saccharomyces cerevisiae x Saccharomyces kudriavzevii (strain VIN7) TaxID=1095631 RepID=H0H1Y5_SACCK|nr:Prp46p [Saccharomyces cerevisiae x Saccharomyces kudriavzevii VIN7]
MDRNGYKFENLGDIDDFYSRIRWNNQFSYMDSLPPHLRREAEGQKHLLERYDAYANKISFSDKESRDVASQRMHEDMPGTSHALVSKKDQDAHTSTFVSEIFQPEIAGEFIVNRYEKLLSQKPEWHAPWKLLRVINGHLGWVRCAAIDPVDNEWFVTGSNDTTMKVWDLATGKLKTTLAGHVMTVRDIAVSDRHPYLFSVSEDKTVKCWDLEKNHIIRDYYGHLSGVRTVSIHPTLDLIATAGRDSVVKLWDIRTRMPVITLVGHKGPINQVQCTPVDPQIVSSSTDATVRLWDIVAGKAMKVLTHHKRSVRATALHPKEFSVASACTDDIRSWGIADGSLLTNFESEKTGIINTLSINQDDVLFAGGDDGTLSFYDYKSGHKYQSLATREMVGSLESERSVLCSTFDKTGLRLITGEADKSIKIWKQDETATRESDPGLVWNPNIRTKRF